MAENRKHETKEKQQSQNEEKPSVRYYRIVYRGVVALLSDEPNSDEKINTNDQISRKTGAYLGYGEIIASGGEKLIEDTTARPQRRMQSSPRLVIRVDRVLTGGYAFDANEQENSTTDDMTPKRGNKQSSTGVVIPTLNSSLLPISDNGSQANVPIAVAIPLERLPKCETGKFLYRVISSTPITILTGPSIDAPTTKAMLIPGSIHEVCLRVTIPPVENQSNFTFLRLTRRRGWILDGKRIPRKRDCDDDSNTDSSWVPFMKEISSEEADECGLSVGSRGASRSATSLLATPISVASRRHRPPRRKGVIESTLPRHVVGPSVQNGNDTSTITDASTSMNTSMNNPHIHQDPRSIMSPSSNISLLSDDMSSVDPANKSLGGTLSPDRSVARSIASTSTVPSFFLMRVNAPRGLKILDAPHFQVNNLIHGSHATLSGNLHEGFSTSMAHTKDSYGKNTSGGNQSIFQTMAGHHTTTVTSKTSNPAVFDSITKARRLPRGSVFEATKRLEASNAFSQGAGLIKLSDNSGWAIIPRQHELNEQYRGYSGALSHARDGEGFRAVEEVGNSMGNRSQNTIFLRVVSRGGITVSLPPISNGESDVDTSPTSSATGSSIVSASGLPNLNVGVSSDSDVASSVGSSFLDSMFRTPRKKERQPESINENKTEHQHLHNRPPLGERHAVSTIIPCGTCVEVDRWVDPLDAEQHLFKNEYARIRGGQGWIPRFANGKPVVDTISPPEFRFGSIWFRVCDRRGIKVRLGPSKKASSIKSDDGVYFRFECGEFLRASEVVTLFKNDYKYECFAKLYRNRHVQLHGGELRPLSSLTTQAEWVQVFGDKDRFLDECKTEPRIERHRQGWRYNVVLDARVTVRRGPSFEAETDGVVLLGGESVLVNERVVGPDNPITWLRLKDGHGWVHNVGQNGESLMIAHSLRHRKPTVGRPLKSGRTEQEDIAYNTIIARLFHNDVPGDSPPRSTQRR
eukprot:jgi/Psemu1/249682/estExt_Genewise1Plus.C_70052